MRENFLKLICQTEITTLKEELFRQLSRRFYRNLIHGFQKVWINQKEASLYDIVRRNDEIKISYFRENEINWEIYPSHCDIKYEDENYLIVNKRSGLLSIPTKSEPFSLYQECMYYLQQTNQPLFVSILNRLDKDTSGLVVIAKNRLAAYSLQPTHEKMIRKYIALCKGIYSNEEGTIKTFIAQKEDSHKRYVSETEGKLAVSHYKVLGKDYEKNTTLVEFELETGRTHQIRLHTAYLGYPIIGDRLYGDGDSDVLCLCSYYIEFINPFLKAKQSFQLESEWIKWKKN